MSSNPQNFEIQALHPSKAQDTSLVTAIVDLVNLVFEETEGDLLIPNHKRTNANEIIRFIEAGELHATFAPNGPLAGVIKIFNVAIAESSPEKAKDETIQSKGEAAAVTAEVTSTLTERKTVSSLSSPQLAHSGPNEQGANANIWSFGMLSVHPSQRRYGLGRRLVQYAEDEARQRSGREMEIILLVPAEEPPHAFKNFLRTWYAKMGYVVVKATSPENVLPHLGNVFSRECLFEICRKSLV